MYRLGRIVPSPKSVYFSISKLMLSFQYSFDVPYIKLLAVYFHTVISVFPFLFSSIVLEVRFCQSKESSNDSTKQRPFLLQLKLKPIYINNH